MHPLQKRVLTATGYEYEQLFPNRHKRWTPEEDATLLRMAERNTDWWSVAEVLKRNPGAVQGRYYVLKAGIKFMLGRLPDPNKSTNGHA